MLEIVSSSQDYPLTEISLLSADISGVSCKGGEVAESVFDRYRIETYKEAGFKPYIIAAMIFNNKFKDAADVLNKMNDRGMKRILG